MARGRKKKEILDFESMQKMCWGKLADGHTLTHDECSYLVDVDDKGTKPSASRRLTKMVICKIEERALKKIRKALGEKFNIRNLADALNLTRDQMPASSKFADA